MTSSYVTLKTSAKKRFLSIPPLLSAHFCLLQTAQHFRRMFSKKEKLDQMPRTIILNTSSSRKHPVPVLKNIFHVFLSTFYSRSIFNLVGFLHGTHFFLQFTGFARCKLRVCSYLVNLKQAF